MRSYFLFVAFLLKLCYLHFASLRFVENIELCVHGYLLVREGITSSSHSSQGFCGAFAVSAMTELTELIQLAEELFELEASNEEVSDFDPEDEKHKRP